MARRVYERETGERNAMKSILTCLVSSPRAELVLESAVALAKRIGARVSLFRCVGLPPEVDQEFYVHSKDNMIDTLLGRARADLDELAKRLPPDLLQATNVRVGTPWDAICTEAKEQNVDLIVIGSHGYAGLDRILGTTAAKVVNHADRSVLVVRNHAVK
jgi:universal stress protein F